MRTAIVIGVLCIAGVAGCTKDLDGGMRDTVFVRGALARQQVKGANACVMTADTKAALIAQGTFDIGVRDDYTVSLLVQSNQAAGSGTTLSSAHVTVRKTDTAARTVLAEFDTIANGYVEGGGVGLVTFTAVDATVPGKIRTELTTRRAWQLLVAEIELTGTDSASGFPAEAPTFRFPISTCNGCLVDFLTGTDVTANMQPNCLRTPLVDPNPVIVTPCIAGQDELVPCELCQGKPACDPRTP